MSRLIASLVLVTLFTSTAVARPFAAPPPPPGGDPVEAPVVDDSVVSRAAVRAALVTRRAQSVQRFRDYWKAGVYPHNTYTDGDLNVWLDEDGHLCAAATIISKSGFAAKVKRQAADDNFIRLADVEDGWLMDWMLVSGLTQEELVMIQKPFDGRPGIGEQPGRGEGGIVMPEPAPDPKSTFADADAKLRRKYQRVDALLKKRAKASLEIAVDRLMERPALARQLLLAADA